MVRVYTDKNCPYCEELKEGLNKLKIPFAEFNVDSPKHKEVVERLFKLAGEAVVPIIIIKPHVLVPKRTFNTIADALKLISDLTKK